MQSEHFMVQNVKCGGCAQNIQQGLQQIDNVENVEVAIESGEVCVSGNTLVRSHIAAKLAELGYPENE